MESTRLIFTKNLILEHTDTVTHGQVRTNDTAKAADGTVVQPSAPATVHLDHKPQVKSVSVQKDADGNLHITLEH